MIIYRFRDENDNEHSIIIKDTKKSEYYPKWKSIMSDYSFTTGELSIQIMGGGYSYTFSATDSVAEAIISSGYLYPTPREALCGFEEDYPWIKF